MEDSEIIELFWTRDPDAINRVSEKYQTQLTAIAFRILNNSEDAKECVNDAYLKIWNAIPPMRPDNLKLFLSRVVRQTAIDRWRTLSAEKRGSRELPAALDELELCVTGFRSVEDALDFKEIKKTIHSFLSELPWQERQIFIRRYWFLDPIRLISVQTGYSQTKVASMLFRTRNKLRKRLEKEGFYGGN